MVTDRDSEKRIVEAVEAHIEYMKAARRKIEAVRLLDEGAWPTGPEGKEMSRRIKALRAEGCDV